MKDEQTFSAEGGVSMIVKSLQVLIHAQYETVWQLLLERVQQPQRHFAGLTDLRTLEQDEDVIVREMKLHGELVVERVTLMPHESKIRQELLEHPQFTGTILTRLVRTARQSPVAPQRLEFDLELMPRGRLVRDVLQGEAEIVAELQGEMNRIKSRAEEIDLRG